MKIRKPLTIIVGVLQSTIAISMLIFACILYFNFFDVQNWLNGTLESVYFHVLAFLVVGFFSLVSGIFLITEWLEIR